MEEVEKKEKITTKETFQYLRKTYAYAKEKKWNLFFFLFGCILSAGVSALSPLLWAKQLLALTNGKLKQLLILGVLIFVVEVARNTITRLNNYNIQIFFHHARSNIQLALTSEILKTKQDDLNTQTSGVFIQRITDDCRSLAEIFGDMVDYLTFITTNIGIFVSIFFLSKPLFLFFFIFLMILYYLQRKKVEVWKENDQKRREVSEKTTGFIGEIVRGAKDIKVLNAEDSMLKEAKKDLVSLNEANWHLFKDERKYRFRINNTHDVLDLLFVILCIFFIKDGSLSVPVALIIFSYQGNILSLTYDIERIQQTFKRFGLSASRVFDIIDNKLVKKESFGGQHLPKIKGSFRFEDVCFSYEDDIPVLNHLSFEIKENETVSFVGKSGAGKSTIFNLLARLYDPTSGAIYLDDINIQELDKDSLRGNISIINQNPYIFNMSIKDNLRLVKEGLTDQEMIEACKLASLHDFIMGLPNGYDTVVGEGGVTLSGGQKQRLAIARALVQKTKIILFDEATSALDNETQKSIQEAIRNMQGEYTILMIAHRLSTVIDSNRLILLQDGKVEATGSHEELMKNNQTYRDLYLIEENHTE